MRSHVIDVAKAGKEDGVEFIAHLSTQLGLERIKRAQALGQRVFTETCPQCQSKQEDRTCSIS